MPKVTRKVLGVLCLLLGLFIIFGLVYVIGGWDGMEMVAAALVVASLTTALIVLGARLCLE